MRKKDVENFIISKEEFKKYFNCRRIITKDELEKYYKKRKIFTEKIITFLSL